MSIVLKNKKGSGIGARVEFCNDDQYVGTLTFHGGGNWQITDSSRIRELGQNPFDEALAIARLKYPKG